MLRTIKLERVSAFRRLLPTDLYLWLKALLLAAVAVQAAQLAWAVVTPVGPLGEWRAATPAPLPAAVQTALLASVDPFARGGAGPVAAAATAVPADLRLFGTRSGPNGSAIIGKEGGEQKSYVVGEEVAPGIKLAGVLFDRVVLETGGSRNELLMPNEGGMVAPAAGPATQSTSSVPVVATQLLDLAPRRSGAAVNGVTVGPNGNPALLQGAGLRPGDVIVAVNGARITSEVDARQLQSSLVPGARLTLSLDRDGRTVPLAVNIPAVQ